MNPEKFTISIKNNILVGRIFVQENKNPSKTIIFLNGSGGTKERFYGLCEFFSEKGYICVCFDFRGRGESATLKTPKAKEQITDATKVIVYLLKRFKKLKEINLVATSMSAHVASCICNYKKKIKKLVLIAPAAYTYDMENKPYTEIFTKDLKRSEIEKSKSILEIRKFKGYLYLVSLNRDTTIPNWMIKAYFDNAKKTKLKKELGIDFRHSIFRYEDGREKSLKLLDKIL